MSDKQLIFYLGTVSYDEHVQETNFDGICTVNSALSPWENQLGVLSPIIGRSRGVILKHLGHRTPEWTIPLGWF